MSEVSDLEAKLGTQQADYLKRLEGAGQLPTIVSDAWNKVDAGGTANLRTQEADLLKTYVSAGAASREKYKDVWDPFKRDTLAAQNTALSYAPIADVRKELAMRAESLGIATASASAMYGAETNRAQTNLGFTQDAYSRAYQREQETTRQAERQQDLAIAAKKSASSGSSAASTKEDKVVAAFQKDLAGGLGSKIAIHGEEDQDGYISREVFISRLKQQYPDIDENDIAAAVYQYYAG